MSSSLMNLGILFILLVAELVCVVKLASCSRRTVFCLLWPTVGDQCMFGVPSTMVAEPMV